jgi:hydroxysqualene dehydroxylase
MTGGRVHVVGAGLAGLAAAAALADAGRPVVLYESSGHAGGRCRSYFDEALGCVIDNGNHLLLSGNASALRYLALIGARDTVAGPAEAVYEFIDAASGERWRLRPNRGRLPWWILSARRRVPGTRAKDYLAALALWRAAPGATVAAVLGRGGALYCRLWQPLAVAALNTAAEAGSARLFRHILAETLGRGGAACRPLLPRQGLSESLVDPALALLRARGAELRFGARLRAATFAGDRITGLDFDDGAVALAAGDMAILAVPAAIAGRLVPGLVVPDAYAPIVNAHFRIAAPPAAPPLIGVVGGAAEWIFCKRQVLSVTVSAADRLVEESAERLAELLWRDVAIGYRLPERPLPPARIVKERRATFLASPEQLRRRPASVTRWSNLLLAGDYVDTGLPATIEGAIRSGLAAAELAVAGGGTRTERGRPDAVRA